MNASTVVPVNLLLSVNYEKLTPINRPFEKRITISLYNDTI